MSDLADFAKKDKIKTGYTPWREKSPENQKAWAEAVDGYKSGISASVIGRWLKQEKGCPLTDATIRKALITAADE
tara:strand:+ start:652 stop:876 length:225 start_codon:yes stop_codon:yes gene_type:complete